MGRLNNFLFEVLILLISSLLIIKIIMPIIHINELLAFCILSICLAVLIGNLTFLTKRTKNFFGSTIYIKILSIASTLIVVFLLNKLL